MHTISVDRKTNPIHNNQQHMIENTHIRHIQKITNPKISHWKINFRGRTKRIFRARIFLHIQITLNFDRSKFGEHRDNQNKIECVKKNEKKE